MTNCVAASSESEPAAAIIGTPASCPAEVTFVIEISRVSITESPDLTEKIPKANDTERYPRQMGSPSRTPLVKPDLLTIIYSEICLKGFCGETFAPTKSRLIFYYTVVYLSRRVISGKRTKPHFRRGHRSLVEGSAPSKKRMGQPSSTSSITSLMPMSMGLKRAKVR